jgi:hypothetical protein
MSALATGSEHPYLSGKGTCCLWELPTPENLTLLHDANGGANPLGKYRVHAIENHKAMKQEYSRVSYRRDPSCHISVRTAPGVLFANEDDLRLHLKSDFHRANLKREIRGRSMLRESEYLQQKMRTDCSSSSSSEEERGDEQDKSLLQSAPIIDVQYSGHVASVWTSVLSLSPEIIGGATETPRRLLNCKFKWLIVLYSSSGHMAAGVFECGNMTHHRTFHRYTSRKKQGGAQSAHDNQNGKAKSIGAQIRRQNEVELHKNLTELFAVTWKEAVAQSSLIFLGTAKANRGVFFSVPPGSKIRSSAFTKGDTRLRKVPFNTGRPTLEEVKKTHQRLGAIKFKQFNSYLHPVETGANPSLPLESEHEHIQALPAHGTLQPKSASLTQDTEDVSHDFTTEIHTAVLNHDFTTLKQIVKTDSGNALNALDSNGSTPLHLAASTGCVNILNFLLEQGADPTVQDSHFRCPYSASKDGPTRKQFRLFFGKYPKKWDYKRAGIEAAGALTQKNIEEKKAKQKQKKRRAKAKKKQTVRARRKEEVFGELSEYTNDRDADLSHTTLGDRVSFFSPLKSLNVSEELKVMQILQDIAAVHLLDESSVLLKALDFAEGHSVSSIAVLLKLKQELSEGKSLETALLSPATGGTN